jgi:ABC-type uncharacterized transport system involved in gliding motility auxiliary subunit
MNKQFVTTLSTVVVIAIIVVVNFIVGGSSIGNFLRFDLTQDKLYTLSQGSKNIIDRLDADKPVTIRLYASSDDRVMPPVLRNYARSIEDLLNEFRKAGSGRVIVEKLAPNPNTDEEDKASADEIQGVPANNDGDKFYLGIAIECLDQKEVLPFLNPNEETKLEYNLARSVQKVSGKGKPVVGIMSPLPIMGSGGNTMPFQQPQQQQQPAWVLVQQLKMDYDVREVPMTADKIDSDVGVLVLVHPANIEDTAVFALDQFVLRGGKLIAFVDPKSVVAEHFGQQQMQNPMMRGQAPMINPQSDLKKLFTAWGVGYDQDQVVLDMGYRANMGGRQNPTAIMLNQNALNKDDRLTKDLNSLFMLTSGTFAVSKVEGIEATTLASSSEVSQAVSNAEADKANRGELQNFSAGGRNLPLVVRLSGKFKTAFPDGPPAKPAAPKEGGGAQDEAKPAATPATAAAPAATAPAAPKADYLKESKADGMVLLFGDADMIYDGLCLEKDPFGGVHESNGNLPLLLGAIELYSGGGDLIAVRNRASTTRPFTTMEKKKSQVEDQFRPQMSKLTGELESATRELSSLRGKFDKKTQRVIIDPSSQAKIDDWQGKQVEIQKEIGNIKKQQRKAIDWEEMKIKLFNIFLMPLVVVAIGLILAMNRRVATAAK